MLSVILALRSNQIIPSKEQPELRPLPRIVFPYYESMKEQIAIFNKFQDDQSANDEFVTIGIDAIKYKSYCIKKNLLAGSVYVSYPNHNQPIKCTQNISAENLEKIAKLAVNKGYFRVSDIKTVKDLASKAPLFMFVARSNSGDIEDKLPEFEAVTQKLMGTTISFAYSTDPIIYEMYANYPYSSFVYISPTGSHISLTDDFKEENLLKFINERNQLFMGTPTTNAGPTFTIVSTPEYYEKWYLKYEKYANSVQKIAFLDSTENNEAALAICHGKLSCVSVLDLSTYRSVVLEDSADVEKSIEDFSKMWNEYSIFQRIFYKVNISFAYLRHTYFVYIAVVTFIILFLILWKFADVFELNLERKKND